MVRRFTLHRDEISSEEYSLAYEDHLNEQQYRAVTAGDGPVLVIAGAGTGKTRTLVYRVAYLVDIGIAPNHILLLTFTRRAADEMRRRAARLLDGRCQQIKGGTFHSFCAGILREYAPTIDFPRSFTILDAADAADVIDLLRSRHGLHRSEERFPRKQTLQSMFSAVVNRQLSLEELLEGKYQTYAGHLEALRRLYRDYQRYKRSKALMDYDDLLARTRELFQRSPEIREQVAGRCRHLLVDEYQDTNRMQADLVEDFSSVHRNVMVVGDDAQSIYGFRGADYTNIFRFRDTYEDTRLIKLEENYRSTQPILDLANEVIAKADEVVPKELFTGREGGDRPALVRAADESYQSRFVVQMILERRESGIPLDRVGVLFRRSTDSYALESALDRRGIPYVKYGGLKLIETAHIKDLLAHLRVIENPRDEVAWNRVLQLLQGIGPKTARDVIEWMEEADRPLTFDTTYTSARYRDRLQQLAETLRRIRDEELSVVDQVEAVAAYYRPILERTYADDTEERRRDIERFHVLAEQYPTRRKLLNRLAVDPIEFSATDAAAGEDEEPALILSTIHSAKGLEFHSVFLIQAVDGALPSSYALRDDGDLEEELRLLYVAITRAEEQLFVSYPVLQSRSDAGTYMSKPSRFLRDIPERLLEPWHLVEEAGEDPPLSASDDADSSEPLD
jgi:DNA helicase-2/ATP-dependent DNA helicase PcrA